MATIIRKDGVSATQAQHAAQPVTFSFADMRGIGADKINGNGGIDGMAFASQSEAGKASLHQLYVRPDTQVQGIGTMLLAEIEMAFPDVRTMKLEVIERNTKAVNFYERKGYTKVGRNEDWGDPNCKEPVLVMEKSLESWNM